MKKPNEKMDEAKLSELMPGFDKDAEWGRLKAQLHPAQQHRKLPVWKMAAAILLLVTAGAAIMFVSNTENKSQSTAAVISDTPSNWADGILPAIPPQHTYTTEPYTQRDRIIVKTAATGSKEGVADTAIAHQKILQGMRRTGEFVCNSTPCPIEICITQMLHCKNLSPSAVKSCSILDPDQARQLRFNTQQATGRNCNVSVSEISIERVATGEMIVLNDKSKPSTAQELFNCLTGNMECSMLAGIFKNDCDNKQRPGNLKIETDAGSIILE